MQESVVNIINNMCKSNRLPHAFLLVGEGGADKLNIAKYIAKVLTCCKICDNTPCDTCRHCKRIDENTHPDIIFPERSGKKLIYNKETIRNICTDAYVKPNDANCKVYIFDDCEHIESATQNLMLKIIEEPPENVYFIFTAVSKSVFLPTILSRVTTLQLADENDSIDSIDEKSVEFAKKIIDAIVSNDEYCILKTLAQIGENREKISEILTLIDKIIRDALVIRLNQSINNESENISLIGCYLDGSKKMAQSLSFRRACYINDSLYDTLMYCKQNVNITAAVSSLSGLIAINS